MTLCVAWRESDDGIRFASDSRIAGFGNGSSDNGIKITAIPVNVFAPHYTTMDNRVLAFSKTFGMCFSGSFLGAFTIREFLTSILQRLQYAPGHSSISFKTICTIVFKFYSHLITKISHDLDFDHTIDFYLAGYCPETKRQHCALFASAPTPTWSPVLDPRPARPLAIGAGEAHFTQTLAATCHGCVSRRCILHAIKTICAQEGIRSVGGPVQFGEFDNQSNFTTLGIIQHQEDGQGVRHAKHFFAGIDMLGDEFDSKGNELFIMGKYLTPFD